MSDLSTIFTHAKVVASGMIGAVATAAALRHDLTTLISGKSLKSQIKEEETRLGEIDEELRRDPKSIALTCEVLEKDRRVTEERLRRLTSEFTRRREDPNYDLSFVQRLFLTFRPDSGRAEVIHWFSRIFVVLGVVSVAVWIHVANQNLRYADDIGEYIADSILVTCCGALTFRAWALAERRWINEYYPKPGLFGTLFVMRRPASTQMLAAQICFCVCAFWVVESLEDFVADLANGELSPTEQSIKFFVPLVAAILCRFWAAAELKVARKPPCAWRRSAIFFRRGWRSVTMIMYIVLLAGASVIVDFKPGLFDEKLHKIAFVVQALISCIALSQWLSVSSQFNSPEVTVVPSNAKSTAA